MAVETLNIARRVAIQAAQEASAAVMPYWSGMGNKLFNPALALKISEEKNAGGNFATIADHASEEVIIKKIRGRFEDHDIVTEEKKGIPLTGSAWRWVNDPIDGTLNFTHGISEFAISLGLIYDNAPVLGVVALPAMNRLVVAEKGRGAQLYRLSDNNLKRPTDLMKLPARLHQLSLKKSLVGFDAGYDDRAGQYERFGKQIADQVGGVKGYLSCIYAQLLVATGELAAYVMEVPKIYDKAGVATILNETRCVSTDMRGEPIDWRQMEGSILVARDLETHRALLEMINVVDTRDIGENTFERASC